MSTHFSIPSSMHDNQSTSSATAHDHAHSGHSIGTFGWLAIIAGVLLTAYLIFHSFQPGGYYGPAVEGGHHGHHELPHYWGIGILPFVGILGAIAAFPLIGWTQHWWESNLNRLIVSVICAALTIIYTGIFVGWYDILAVLEHAIVVEYIPFIVLLFSLYVISGGIRISGDLAAKPGTNTAFLAIGAGLASFIGTTGASMLLIRPLLQTNHERKHVLHTVIFFIFLVSNIGGSLLPIGDPPLFLGYLKGVPFLWTFGLTAEWAICCVILLIVYYIWDKRAYSKEDISTLQKDQLDKQPLRLQGLLNIVWLTGVVFAVALLSPGKAFSIGEFKFTVFPFLREIVMMAFVGLSLLLTSSVIREENKFNYHAILEVGALFIGIFIAMQIPVQVLELQGSELGLTNPAQFFWATGSLSAFLDNAPTYVVFFETAHAMPVEGVAPENLLELKDGTPIREDLLIGISLGAVFMGAMTYIGNGPNFMVKSIAEQAGIRMPSFFGYMFKYSIPILVPIFVLITILFLL